MSSEKRPDSLAAQAAAWVPPWERPNRPPDRAYHAEARAAAEADAASDTDATSDTDSIAFADLDPPDEVRALSDREPDSASPEVAPLPGESGEPAVVDAPAERPEEGEAEPTEIPGAPEVPLPASVEEAAEQAPESESGEPVDAPVPAEDDVAEGRAAADVDGRDSAASAADPDSRDAAGAVDADAALGDGPEVSTFRNPVPTQGRGGHGPAPAVVDFGARTPSGFFSDNDAEPADGSDHPSALKSDDVAEPTDVGDHPSGLNSDDRAEPDDQGDHPPLKSMDDAELRAALEAILLVVDEPVAEMQLAQIMEQPTERVATMLEDISARYTAAGHGFDLRRAAGGWRLYTRPEYAAYVERFVLDGQSVRLTQAALETLAVVAYKQPVTRSRISAIRGVNCDGVMRTLVTRGLIEECGVEGETGAYLYRTTPLFLEKLGLNSVDQLPPLAPFLPDDVEEVLDASG